MLINVIIVISVIVIILFVFRILFFLSLGHKIFLIKTKIDLCLTSIADSVESLTNKELLIPEVNRLRSMSLEEKDALLHTIADKFNTIISQRQDLAELDFAKSAKGSINNYSTLVSDYNRLAKVLNIHLKMIDGKFIGKMLHLSMQPLL